MLRSLQTRVAFRNGVTSPLGQVTSGNILRDSRGIPPGPMRVFGQYALVYLLEGGGRYRDAQGLSLAVGPGDLLFVFPELAHTYGPGPSQHWTELHLVFDGPAFDLWRSSGLLDSGCPVHHLEPVEHWLDRLLPFLEAPLPATPAGKAQEVSRLLGLLTDILAPAALHDPGTDPSWLAQARGLLESDLGTETDLADVAAQCGLPYETFRKYFARETGLSPARYRAARRIDAARELLARTRLTPRQIADALGFADEFHFAKRFKQMTGRTPRQFRLLTSRCSDNAG